MKKAPHNFPAAGALGKQLTLIDPLALSPRRPNRNTLPDRALNLLLDGRTFDHPDFEGDSRSCRLAAYVHELRDLGWPVENIEIPSPTTDRPPRNIGLYRLPRKVTAEANQPMNGGTR